jgi:long-chain acyl-CoA synthetase
MRLIQTLTRAVQTRPRTVATIHAGRERTWSEIGERVARGAAALRSLGVREGDRVAILALNSDNYLELFYAIAWAGAVSTPLNTRWAKAETTYALNDCGARVLVVDDAFEHQVDYLLAHAPVETVISIGEAAPRDGVHGYENLLQAHDPLQEMCGAGDDLASICYTGGTTGTPKGVMLSHTNLVFASTNWIASLDFSEDTVFLHSAGFFHLAGSMPAFALTLAGGTHVCLPKFDAELAFHTIDRYKVNYCLFVPTMINMMLHHPKIDDYDLGSLRTIEYGASPISDSLLAAALKRLPECRFIQGYGMTETTALTLSVPWKYHFDGQGHASKRTATGRAAYGMDVRIVDTDRKEVPRGVAGEIAVRGPQVMLGYWNKPKETAEVLEDGWMYSGDAGTMDEDGFVYLLDRLKDMIVSGGENVYSREVENAVLSHPAVRDCAVVAVPSDEWGEAVHAVVVFKDGMSASQDDILAHCRRLIAAYKCPRSMEVREELPLSAAGKILKAELRKGYWADKDRQIN